MRKINLGFLMAIFLLVTVRFVAAQEFITEHVKGGDGPGDHATVDDLAWIAGSWSGDALGGIAEEVWSEPSGGTMLGMFKLTQGEETVFSELMMIVPDGESIKMILKHFDADLTGWEEKDEVETFRFLSQTETVVYFDGLTVEKVDEGHLSIYVVMHGDGDSVSELAFHYSAVN